MRKFITHLDRIVPVHHPRVLVETAARQGADRVELLENTGISDTTLTLPEARISYHQFAVLASNAVRLTRNPALGLDVGRNIRFAQMGPLALALMNSVSVGASLETLLRYSHGLMPVFDLSFAVRGDRGPTSQRSAS